MTGRKMRSPETRRFLVFLVLITGFASTKAFYPLYPEIQDLHLRANAKANATCGESRPETYCYSAEFGSICKVCDSNQNRHAVQDILDGRRDTWWQSPSLHEGERNFVTITINLNEVYEITEVVLKAHKVNRPGNWILEKSVDGVTFLPWQFHAISNMECWEAYRINPTPDFPSYQTDDQVICTEYFSAPGGNQMAFFETTKGRSGEAANGDTLRQFMKARYIRIRMQKLLASTPEGEKSSVTSPTKFGQDGKEFFYAISDVEIRGRCACNGHASRCIPDGNSGQMRCQCEHNTCGKHCDQCCPKFSAKPWVRNDTCTPCECNGHATECRFDEQADSVCVHCTGNTAGQFCEKCKPGFYRTANMLPHDDCIPCKCGKDGASGDCVPDNSFDRREPGECICATGYTGKDCTECEIGYRKSGSSCIECSCDPRGAAVNDCDADDCRCKSHVKGITCNQCKAGFYNLNFNNPNGCAECYCFGITNRCQESDLPVRIIEKEPAHWEVSDLNNQQKLPTHPSEDFPGATREALLDLATFNPADKILYWKAPREYVGAKMNSYGAAPDVKVSFEPSRGDVSEGGFLDKRADIVLRGKNGKLIGAVSADVKPTDEQAQYHIQNPLREHGFYYVSDPDTGELSKEPVSREDFTVILYDLEDFYVRARYHKGQYAGWLHNASMPVASTEVNSIEKALFLEHCFCPEGYEGLSCELCAKGYRRVNNTLVKGICEKCPCNNHVDRCDPYTAQCGPCLHNTMGTFCEKCKFGFYGDATIGKEDDCKPCACPLTIPSNNFADGCKSVSETEYECINCKPGYTGKHCERCSEGYFGNPTVPGGKCIPCQCGPNVDKSRKGWCDHRTGYCNYCLGNTDGWNCSRCKKLFYGNPQIPDCKACECDPVGSSEMQCDPVTGQCKCHPGFGGRTCKTCDVGFGDIAQKCIECKCNPIGSNSTVCDPYTGHCICKEGVFGQHCDQCKDLHYGFSTSGCKFCDCYAPGSHEQQCDVETGQCKCYPHVIGRRCDKCESGFWNIQTGAGCEPCNCNSVGASGPSCDIRTGQCICKPGVGGKKCDVCLPNHRKFGPQGCFKCEPCDAPGHVCDEETGSCICPKNTGGPDCSRCKEGYFGYIPQEGCRPCDCNSVGSLSVDCDGNGQCRCREGFEGVKCDKCTFGHYGFPHCRRCECNLEGTKPEQCRNGICGCDDDGYCHCKENVEGTKCDTCKPGAFALQYDNPRGCTECFVFGRTYPPKCTQSPFVWSEKSMVLPYEVTFRTGGSRDKPLPTREGFTHIPMTTNRTTVTVEVPFMLSKPLYWELPEQFLGDKVRAYNGLLKFKKTSQSSDVFPERVLDNHPLVVLFGNFRLRLAHKPPKQERPFRNGHYSVRLHEDEWMDLDNPRVNVTRPMLMVALQKIDHWMIRATEGSDVKFASLEDVVLEYAVPEEQGIISGVLPRIAYGVELGFCPREYTASSCQDPAPGYYRKRKPNFLDSKDILDLVGWAEPCECNGMASECDKETGVCFNCRDNTVGDHCEKCAPGFYGDPVRGIACNPCACPRPDNSFSDTCEYRGEDFRQYVCTNCQKGYTGLRCEICADGYYGDPNVVNGTCKACNCNPYGTIQGGVCDKKNGQCPCIPGISGRDCTVCPRRHVFTEFGCKSCDDTCTGALLNDIEQMFDWLNHIDINELLKAPWYNLLRLSDSLRRTKNAMDDYRGQIEEAEGILRESLFSINLESRIQSINYQLQTIFNQKIPRVRSDLHEIEVHHKKQRVEIEDEYKLVQHLVELMKKYGFGPGSTTSAVERMYREAEAWLEFILSVRREVAPLPEEALRELRQANGLIDRIRNAVFDEGALRALLQRLNILQELLKSALTLIIEKGQNPTKEALGIIDGQMRVFQSLIRMIAAINEASSKTTGMIAKADTLLTEIRKLLRALQLKFDEIPGLTTAIVKRSDEVEKRRAILYRLNPEYRIKYVEKCIAHSNAMTAEIDRISRMFQQTALQSLKPQEAAKVYQLLIQEIRAAADAVRDAEVAFEMAREKSHPRGGESLLQMAERSLTISKALLADAKNLKDRELPGVHDSLRNKKRLLSDADVLIGEIMRLLKAIPPLDQVITSFTEWDPNDPKYKTLQDQVAFTRQRVANLVRSIEIIKTRVEELYGGSSAGLDDIDRILEEIKGGIGRVLQATSATEEKVKRLEEKEIEFGANLDALRRKILNARQKASSIRVSLNGKDNGVCHRTFRPMMHFPTSTTIEMTYSISSEAANSLLFIAANTRGKNDFIAVEMVNRRIKCSWNIGDETVSVENELRIDNSDTRYNKEPNWYDIVVERTRNVVSLYVKRRKDNFILMARGSTSPERGQQVIDSSSYYSIGSIPSNITASRQLVAHNFVGCLASLKVDGKQIGLWDFHSNRGCGGCVEGPTKETKQGVYQFSGSGYSIVDQPSTYRDKNYFVQFAFRTLDENALLFFAPNRAVGDYFAIFLRDGHVVFRFRVGQHDLEVYTERRYNDGKWTVVSAEKNQLDGILSVIPKDGYPERLTEQMRPSAQSALPSLRQAKLYFGGMPPVFPSARFSDRVILDAFLGCIKDTQLYSSGVDLMKTSHGVELGCEVKKIPAVSFDGKLGNYVELKSHKLLEQGNFGFTFATEKPDGLLMLSTFLTRSNVDRSLRENYYSVSLKEGHLIFKFGVGENHGEVQYRTKETYNDGRLHTVSVHRVSRKISINVDDGRFGTREALRLPAGIGDIMAPGDVGGLFLGGCRTDLNTAHQVATSTAFQGVIKDVIFNDNIVGFEDPINHRHAKIGRELAEMKSYIDHEEDLVEERITEHWHTVSSSHDTAKVGRCNNVPHESFEPNAMAFGESVHSHISYPIEVSQWRRDFSIRFEVKAHHHSGLLAMLRNSKHGNHIAVLLRDGHIVVQHRDRHRNIKEIQSSSAGFADERWHIVSVRKANETVTLEVDDVEQGVVEVKRNMPVSAPLYVGGLPMSVLTTAGFSSDPSMSSVHGCMSKLELNGQTIDMQTSTRVTRYNAGPCPTKTRRGAHFRGDAYATYTKRFEFAETVRVELNIKTNAKDAVLVSYTSESERPTFSLEIFNGQLVAALDVGTIKDPLTLRANTTLNCNRDWHPVRASFGLRQVWLQLDDERPVVTSAPESFALPPEHELTRGPLYIGGLPYTADRGVILAQKNLVGCISDMSIAGEPVSWGSLREAVHVRHHMCPDF
ncbi:laminin subunit alpha-1 [Galendromus occidentalis]|uniref:Laminin subunit alpha-1 n=1 Tax=Galendromus occidentalis TaxID=34638 RepID=A0AAJ7SCQ8_9ACAR|nr:laminin subunit alpha-1 [Galendromus occidentalis]